MSDVEREREALRAEVERLRAAIREHQAYLAAGVLAPVWVTEDMTDSNAPGRQPDVLAEARNVGACTDTRDGQPDAPPPDARGPWMKQIQWTPGAAWATWAGNPPRDCYRVRYVSAPVRVMEDGEQG